MTLWKKRLPTPVLWYTFYEFVLKVYGTKCLKKIEITGGELSLYSEFGYSQHWIIWVILVFVFLSQSTYANTQIACTHTRTHGNTHTHFTMLSLLKAYGRNLIYFPNVSEACSQVSPLNPCWYKKKGERAKRNQMQSLRYWRTFNLAIWRRLLKGNKSARGRKKTYQDTLIWTTNVNQKEPLTASPYG